MGGYGFDTGQKPHRPETQPVRQVPRGAVPEKNEWLDELAHFLSTDPRSLRLETQVKNPTLSWKRVSNLPFQPKQSKHLLRLRSERHMDTEMEIKGVARREITGGRPFYQILTADEVSSTYRVNCPANESVEPDQAARFSKGKRPEPRPVQKSPKKRRRSREPISTSTFLGLPKPSFNNMADIEREIPHLVPKKTKSRHSRQISASKLNSNNLLAFGRFRGKKEVEPLERAAPLVNHKTIGSFLSPKVDSAAPGSLSAIKVPHPTSSEVGAPINSASSSQPWGRTRASLGLTHISMGGKHSEPVRDRALGTPNPSIIPSSEILSPDDPSEYSDMRSHGTRATSQTSTPAPSAMINPANIEMGRAPPGCPTPAPTGPLPPLPERTSLPNQRHSKPIVIASDIMPTPEVSPGKSSPTKSAASPQYPSQKLLERFPQRTAGRSDAIADQPSNWSTIPTTTTALPIRVRSNKTAPTIGPRALGDPFQHRVTKTKATKQRDVQQSKSSNNQAAESVATEAAVPIRGGDGEVAIPTSLSKPTEPARQSDGSTVTGTSLDQDQVARAARDTAPVLEPEICLSSIRTVAEVPPPAAISTIPSPPRPHIFSLPRTTYRSHGTQCSPRRLPGRMGSSDSPYSHYPDATVNSTVPSNVAPVPSPHGAPASKDDSFAAREPYSDPKGLVTTPTRSPRRPVTGQGPTGGKSSEHLQAPPSPLRHLIKNGSGPAREEPRNSMGRLGEGEGSVEARLRAFERKTVLLEAALLAVINASARLGSGLEAGNGSDGGGMGIELEAGKKGTEAS